MLKRKSAADDIAFNSANHLAVKAELRAESAESRLSVLTEGLKQLSEELYAEIRQFPAMTSEAYAAGRLVTLRSCAVKVDQLVEGTKR